ncbi:MAG: ECF transporter S component [Oscillospiraceae bacterium]|nr:ECF transporter S component [Oscillospiraceae bacterium]
MSSSKIHRLTLSAILAAVIVLMAFTPLGYLKLGAESITFLTVPVVIGAITLGPVYGGILGAVFGLTSFAQCFGMDVGGTAMFGINPVGTAIVCLVPRILIGVITGLLFPVLRRLDRTGVVSFALTSVAGALTNTVFFVSLVVLFFRDTYFGGSAFWPIFISFFTVNAIVEVIVCGVLGAALSKVLARFTAKKAV